MIGRQKDADKLPKRLQRTGRNQILVKLGEVLRAKSGARAKPRYYSQGEIREELIALYEKKCCYCESDLQHMPRSFEIDHYRPKDGIHQGDWTVAEQQQVDRALRKLRAQPSFAGKTNEQKKADEQATIKEEMPGYYWLCYEWTNLIPACKDCNGKKSNHFPIDGPRAWCSKNRDLRWYPDKLRYLNERPLLLHPEIDHPQDFLRFQANGKVMGKDGDGRGERTIQICGLDREGLDHKRSKLLAGYRDRLEDAAEKILFLYQEEEPDKQRFQEVTKRFFVRVLTELEQQTKPAAAYSAMMSQAWREPERFFLANLKGDIRKIIELAFWLYKTT